MSDCLVRARLPISLSFWGYAHLPSSREGWGQIGKMRLPPISLSDSLRVVMLRAKKCSTALFSYDKSFSGAEVCIVAQFGENGRRNLIDR